MNIDEPKISKFSREMAEESATSMMRNLAQLTCRKLFLSELSDIEEINHARKAVSAVVDTYFDLIQGVIAERRANLERYRDLKVISLGEDCFSRAVATQWGLKKSAMRGECSHPFDLAIHPLPRIANLIATDFENYLDPAHLHYSREQSCCRNHLLNITFNHEHGKEYAENGFALLRERYRRRIEHFNNSASEGGRVVFLLHIGKPRPNAFVHVKEIAQAVRRKFQRADILLICINTTDSVEMFDAAKRDILRLGPVEIVDAPYPMANYVWYAPMQCLSPEGIEFERNLVAELRGLIDRSRTVAAG